MVLLDQYTLLNNSFKEKLVFNLGVEAGFFSEYNNMILAMLYCLKHKISFSLHSSSANFKISKGWQDYFSPFCAEDSNDNHARFNWRMPNHRHSSHPNLLLRNILNVVVNPGKNALDPIRKKIVKQLYFKSSPYFNYFTYDLWPDFRTGHFQKQFFNIPELGIAGDIQDACAALIDMTWKFNMQTKQKIDKIISSLNLPTDYVGLHIRRGDKNKEFEFKGLQDYITKAESLSIIKVAFVLTDDYEIIENLNVSYPSWYFHTLCKIDDRGYHHKQFEKEGGEYKNEKQIILFASIEILSKANLFVGTFSSNPGMFMGMRLPKDRCFGVDFEKWSIF